MFDFWTMSAWKSSEFVREGHRLRQFWEIVARYVSGLGQPAQAGKRDITSRAMGRGGSLKRDLSGAQYPYSFRKPVDHIGGSRWCLTRTWVFVVILGCMMLLASFSSVGISIQAKIFNPRRVVVTAFPLDPDPSSQLVWDRRTEQMFDSSFRTIRRTKTDGGARTRLALPSEEKGNASPSSLTTTPFIEDLVVLPDYLDFFIVRHGTLAISEAISACSYGKDLEPAPSRVVDLLPDRRLAVTCARPPELRTVEQTLKLENVSIVLADGATIAPHEDGSLEAVRWDETLVYAVQSTEDDVVLYVKNVFDSKKATEYTELENFRCLFGDSVETPVTGGALEVFRCEAPRVLLHEGGQKLQLTSSRVKVHLVYKGKRFPSVAYYNLPPPGASSLSEHQTTKKKKKHLVCSCTMVWNVAKFLKEWVLFNSDLGVEKYFLYDNNSEDDLDRVVSELSEFHVTRRSWPWVKTQEAGFSHCAIEAQRECTWVLFTDVDEYLFPKRWLDLVHPEKGRAAAGPAAKEVHQSPLASLIEDTVTKVANPTIGKSSKKGPKAAAMQQSLPPPLALGQISFLCRNFGPSGQTTSPADGVTQGYTCREQREQRHKSLVYFPAVKSTLQNVIHHFFLKPEYQTVSVDVRQAVVNHYKFQAWSEFETKFTKRASTYVVDWKEPKNLNSRDRPEGLGPEATKPPDWETSHCEKNDTALRDYSRRRFGVLGEGGHSVKLAWEL